MLFLYLIQVKLHTFLSPPFMQASSYQISHSNHPIDPIFHGVLEESQIRDSTKGIANPTTKSQQILKSLGYLVTLEKPQCLELPPCCKKLRIVESLHPSCGVASTLCKGLVNAFKSTSQWKRESPSPEKLKENKVSTPMLLEYLGGSTPLQRRRTSLGKELRESYPCLLVYTCGLSCALHIASVAYFVSYHIGCSPSCTSR